MSSATVATSTLTLAAALLLGCGSNAPTIPDELRGGSAGCSAPAYPEEGFGSEAGDVARNACFRGYRAPGDVPPSPAALETVALSDYYDPAGTKGFELLLINTAAIWCGACVSEHERLSERDAQYRDRGLVILGTLFQDAERNPATLDDLDRWIASFGTTFPMVADPDYQLGSYASAETAPLNLVVDARDMRILRKFIGDQESVLWPYLDAELDARAREADSASER